MIYIKKALNTHREPIIQEKQLYKSYIKKKSWLMYYFQKAKLTELHTFWVKIAFSMFERTQKIANCIRKT